MSNTKLKLANIRGEPKNSMFELKHFYQVAQPNQIENANSFPFREVTPLYLKSQLRKQSNHGFLFHNLNKKLNSYFKKEFPSLTKKYKKSWKLMGLRDIIMGLKRNDEIHLLKDHWLKQLSKAYDKKVISMNVKKYPRLKEFIEKKRKDDNRKLKFLRKLFHDLGDCRTTSTKRKFLNKQFKHQLEFTKQNIRYMNVLLQMMIGNRKYKSERISKLHRATILLNILYNVFGTNVNLSLKDMLKTKKKILKKKPSRRVMTFVVHTKPRFDERRALNSICKKHFIETFCPPKMALKQEKITTREHFMQENRMKIKANIKLPATKTSTQQFAFKGKFFEKADLDNELLERIKKDFAKKGGRSNIELNHDVNVNIKTEILPYNLPEYEKRVHKTYRPKRVDGFMQFFEDFKGIFRSRAEEIVKLPSDVQKIDLRITDFIRKKIPDEAEQIETSVSSHLTLPEHSDSSRSSEDVVPAKQIVDEPEPHAIEVRVSSVAEKENEETEVKPKVDEEQVQTRGGWRLLSVKKATYIILRFLHDMAKERFLPEKKVVEDSLSEHSTLSPPSSESIELPPLFALKSLLAEKKKEKPLKSPLKYLEKCAKKMYNKVKRNKCDLINKCKEHESLFTGKCGIPLTIENNIKELFKKWDTDQLMNNNLTNVSSLSTLYTESDESAMYEIDPTIFDYKGHPRENKKTTHVEVLSLLILFLSIAHKIINVRQALRKFKDERNASFKKNFKLRQKQKSTDLKKSGDKTISLSHFREFLKKRYGLHETEEYVKLGQRYCPDYVFFESRKELKKETAPIAAGSGEEIGVPATVRDSRAVVFSDTDISHRKGEAQVTEADDSYKKHKSLKEKHTSLIEDDRSYISWKGPPCEDDFDSKPRVYFMKHSTEWAPYPDFSDVAIDKKFVYSDFFEFPSSLNIPRLVTRYYRHLPVLKLPETYILDPCPESLKWRSSCWTESEENLPYYEKYDSEIPWMSKYFNAFWIAEEKKEWSRDEIQKLLFSSWCGNIVFKGDDTVKFLEKFSEAIDNFEKEKKTVKKIYDVDRPGQHTWEWIVVNKYVKNISPIDLLGIHKWYRDLNKMYNEADFKEDSRSTVLSVLSTNASLSHKSSNVDEEPSRKNEKVEDPLGFPLKDFNSLKEVVTSFIELVKKFRSYRVAPYGEKYRPITEYYLKRITEECGFVETNDDPNDHPNIRLAPARAICYSEKEKQFYYHSNNFIDSLQKKYPQRFLKMPFHVRNEYGSMKHVCTFVSTRRLSFPELNTWKGCMRTVKNKFECVPLSSAQRPPRLMKSPFTTMQERKGNVFELSILLTGLLIAAGYDAYCVCGTATYHRALYGNTDDVSPDESDVDAPSTHRYKQCNLLPPFSSRWYRDSSAYFDPITYQQMEIARLNKNKKKLFMEEYNRWPKTDKEILAEYNKDIDDNVIHKSRFDNPAIALPGTGGTEEMTKDKDTGDNNVAIRKLDELYEKLIAERGQKEEEARRKEAEKKMSMRTYIHESPKEPKSVFAGKMMEKNRIEMAKKRSERKKLKDVSPDETKVIEQRRYFSWLYGPNGPHPEYTEMLKKDRERATKVHQLPEINLLQFIDIYDPLKHRLEIMTGERLHYYQRDSHRCKKKLKQDDYMIWLTDMKRLDRILTRRDQYRKVDEQESKKKRFDERKLEIGSSSRIEEKLKLKKTKKKPKDKPPKLVTAKEIKINPNVTAVTHRAKLIESPLIRKLWLNLSKEFSESYSFQWVKDLIGFTPRRIKRQNKADIKIDNFTDAIKLLEGTYYMKHINAATQKFVEPILEGGKQSNKASIQSLIKARSKLKARQKIHKAREIKLLKKSHYIPSRIHCWVLVKDGTRNVKKPFFIDVFTGVRYPVTDKNYLKISCVWNDKNYYIPRYVATFHAKTRKFELKDNMYWFHLLPLEPMSNSIEKKRKPWWWDIKGHPHVLQHIEMPPYWGRRVRVPPLEWDKMFANTNKKTFYYKRTMIEVYDQDGRPADGLVKRISRYLDMKRTTLESVDTKYEMRKDRLMWRHFDANSGYVEERFEEGRPDHLKSYRFLAFLIPGLYTPKEFLFYGNRREDKLTNILISDKYMMAEFKEGRMDHLKRVRFEYARDLTSDRFFVIDEYSRRVKRVCARYRKLSFHFQPWKQYFKEFSEIPIKLEINMKSMFSEYWYWDENLQCPIKWVAEHLDEQSKRLKFNNFLDTHPIVFGVGRTLQDTHSQMIRRKERYARRESNDRTYFIIIARELERIVCDTMILREYEKIIDVLRGADELKRLNVDSEKAMDTMKTYFEAEREMLNRDFENTMSKKGLQDIWCSDDKSLTGQLFNYFIKEKYWIHFLIGCWDEMNKKFHALVKERKEESPLFKGYSDLLQNLVQRVGLGFGLTKATFPKVPKGTKDLVEVQIKVPMQIALTKLDNLKNEMLENHNGEKEDGSVIKKEEAHIESTQVIRETSPDKTLNDSSCTLMSVDSKVVKDLGKYQTSKKKKYSQGNEDNYTTIDMDKQYLLKDLMLQIVRFLTPKEFHALFKIRFSPNIGWSKNFIELFNRFIGELEQKGIDKSAGGKEALELINYQHPYRSHVKQHGEVLGSLKELKPCQRLTEEEKNQIIKIYNRTKNDGRFEEEDINDLINVFSKKKDLSEEYVQDYIVSFLEKKKARILEPPKPRKILPWKKKAKNKKSLEINFTFDNEPSHVEEKKQSAIPKSQFDSNIVTNKQSQAQIDHYKLFIHKYKKVTDSVKGLKSFLYELNYSPRLSLVLERLNDNSLSDPLFSFDLFKKSVMRDTKNKKRKPKHKYDGPGDRKLKLCYLDKYYNYNNRFYMYDNIWRDEWMASNVTTGPLSGSISNLATMRNCDIGVIDVINLFSKPSELQFVERKNEKVYTLQPVHKEKVFQLFDKDDKKELDDIFPIDTSLLELCEERIPKILEVPSEDSEFETSKSLNKTEKDEIKKILKKHHNNIVERKAETIKSVEPLRTMSLEDSIKSCPHCIRTYYKSNKERMEMLQYIVFQRDLHVAYCMAKPNNTPQPANILEIHKNKIDFYQKYIGFLQDSAFIYNTYKNKLIADECRQYKYFLELLNYKLLYDYFPINVLFRKYRYETRPWSIYPEDFEFVDAKLYEKMILDGNAKQLLSEKKIIGFPEKACTKHETIPFQYSQCTSIDALSIPSSDDRPNERIKTKYSITRVSKFEGPSKRRRRKAYPEINSQNSIEMEIYRDIKPKHRHTKPHDQYKKKISIDYNDKKSASTSVTKKIWK